MKKKYSVCFTIILISVLLMTLSIYAQHKIVYKNNTVGAGKTSVGTNSPLQCTSKNISSEPKTYLVGAGRLSSAEKKRITKKWGVLTVPQGETERAKEVRKRAISYQQQIRDRITESMNVWIKTNPNATAEEIENRRRQGQERIKFKINKINAENKVRMKLKSWDWRTLLDVGPVLDQGENCSTCWAFAATSAAASSLQKNYEDTVPLANYIFPDQTTGKLSDNPFFNTADGNSPIPFVQDLLNCMPIKQEKICDPGWHGIAFDFMIYKKGIPVVKSESANISSPLRYTPKQKFSCQPSGGFLKAASRDYVNSPPDKLPSVEQLKTALIEHGPLAMPIFYDECLVEYKGGIFNEFDQKESGQINHVVLLVGWDDKKQAWLIKNSWGKDWGENGFAWIKYGSNNVGVFLAWVDAAR